MKVCEISDGAVVGSSIVKIIENNINNEEKMITLVANFVKQLKESIVIMNWLTNFVKPKLKASR